MGIPIDPKPPSKNWGGAIEPAIQAIAKLFGQSYVDAVFRAYDAVREVRSENENLQQRAWSLWRESVALTLEIFFDSAQLTRRPTDKEEFDRFIASILLASAETVEREAVQLTAFDLKKPSEFRLYKNLRDRLPELARLVAPEHIRDDKELQRRLDRAFSQGFFRARTEGADHFAALDQALCGDSGEALRRWDEWQRYYDHLRWAVEDAPLFGQSENGPSLKEIFVPLRCYWRERPGQPIGKDDDSHEGTKVNVAWLQETLLNWLHSSQRSDLLRIVTGGPGCGKSSSARILALEVARQDTYNVYLIPLQDLDVARSIEDIVSHHVRRVRLGGRGLSASPIEWQDLADKPLFLVFDGLDEVARPDTTGPDITRKFINSLRVWLHDVHRDATEVRVRAIVLGRPQAAEEAADEIMLRDEALLHVAPLCELNEDRVGGRYHRPFRMCDPAQVADIDQRLVFWEKWSLASNINQKLPEALSAPELSDLTAEPLLLYLLIVSGFVGDRWPEAAENRNCIYEEIFRQVHQRDVGKGNYGPKKGLENADDFFTLMECLGLGAWQGAGRTVSSAHFNVLRDEIYAPELAGRFESLDGASLRNVALQFFTHQGGFDEPGYAFIHKTFGEYLAARALITASEKWLKRYANVHSDFAVAWLQLTGHQRQNPYILKFMIDEARHRVKPSRNRIANYRLAREHVAALCEVARVTLREGFPAHGPLKGIRYDPNWRRRERIQRNAEEALYATMHAWAEAGYPMSLLNKDDQADSWTPGPISIEWFPGLSGWGQPADMMLKRLGGQFGSSDWGILSQVLARWTLQNERLALHDWRGFDLRGSNLSFANLSCTCLHGADLKGALLHSSDLSWTDLSGADLSDANLSDANLYGTKCSRLNLTAARLHSADLREAIDLTQDQIDNASGNRNTKLPKPLVHPPHWS